MRRPDASRNALLLGGVLFALAAVGGWLSPSDFFPAYLWSYQFFLNIALGALAILMMHHLTGGAWGFVIRRILEAAAMTLPLLTLLFIPLLFGMRYLYPWADPGAVAGDPLLRHRAGYLNPVGFTLRAALYFAVWCALAFVLRRWSREQDRTSDPGVTTRFQRLCGPGLLLYLLTVSFAAVDWLMSLDRDYFSTTFGLILIAGQGVAAFAVALLAATRLAGRDTALTGRVGPENFRDLGNLLLSFVLLWAYVSFTQFLINWAGNAAHEVTWYVRRSGGWGGIAVALIALHFFLPFFLLLFGGLKREPSLLAGIAVLLLAARALETYWLVVPSLFAGFHVSFFDVLLPGALGALCLGAFLRHLSAAPLLPLHDPRLVSEPPPAGTPPEVTGHA